MKFDALINCILESCSVDIDNIPVYDGERELYVVTCFEHFVLVQRPTPEEYCVRMFDLSKNNKLDKLDRHLSDVYHGNNGSEALKQFKNILNSNRQFRTSASEAIEYATKLSRLEGAFQVFASYSLGSRHLGTVNFIIEPESKLDGVKRVLQSNDQDDINNW